MPGKPPPTAKNKWLTASVVDDAAKARQVQVHIVCDFVHVLEYIWSSVWSFFAEGDPAAEEWVAEKALAVLGGQACTVAAAIRGKATCLGLDARARENADNCADYLLAKRDYLNYSHALEQGWPIATGVIEGACRHVVKDRLDLTGSRWGLEGAEAILKLRALRSNADSDDYWTFHLNKMLNGTPNTDLLGFPDEDDLAATRGLATDLRLHQLADKPGDLSRDRDVDDKPTRTAGAPRAPRSGSGAAAPSRSTSRGPFCQGAADVDHRASRRSARQHDDQACR